MELNTGNWIKIKNEKDLPTELGKYQVIVNSSKNVIVLTRDYLIQAWHTKQITYYKHLVD